MSMSMVPSNIDPIWSTSVYTLIQQAGGHGREVINISEANKHWQILGWLKINSLLDQFITSFIHSLKREDPVICEY